MEDDETPQKRSRRASCTALKKISKRISQAERLRVRVCRIGQSPPHLVCFVSNSTGSVSTVWIAPYPTLLDNGGHCDCKNAASTALKVFCEHTMFVLLKGFLVPREAALLHSGALTSDNIRLLFGEDNAGLREAHERLLRLAVTPRPGTFDNWDPTRVYVLRYSKT